MIEVLFAAMEGNLDLVRCLIEKGVDIKPTLTMAILGGEFNALKLLIDNGFIDVNAPFDSRSEKERKPFRKGPYIFEVKPDINTPLIFAIKNRNLKITKLLIENGACLDSTPEFNPLLTAYKLDYTEIIELLITSILLKNPGKEKPNYIKKNNELSIYWDKKVIETKLLLHLHNMGLPERSIRIVLNKAISGENTLLNLSAKTLPFFNNLVKNSITSQDPVELTGIFQP